MSIVLGKTFASILIKASDFKVQDSQPQIGKSLEISNTLWRLKCIPNYGSEFSLEMISCTFAIFAFFPLSGAFLWEKLLYLQNVVTCFSIAASHNFWWSPSHRWGKHKSSLATLVTKVCSSISLKLGNCICSDRLGVFLTVQLQYFWLKCNVGILLKPVMLMGKSQSSVSLTTLIRDTILKEKFVSCFF